MTEEFTVDASAQYLDATFEDFIGASCFPGQTAAQGCMTDAAGRSFQDVSGQTIQNAPEWKLSFTPRYERTIANDGRIFGQAVASYQSEVQYSLNQNPLTIQDGYTLVDLTAGYIAPDDRYRFTLFVKNATDELYFNSIGGTFVNAPGGTFHIIPRNAERTVGAEFSLSF